MSMAGLLFAGLLLALPPERQTDPTAYQEYTKRVMHHKPGATIRCCES